MARRPIDAPAMSWEQFTEIFLERFVPYSLRDRRRDEFDRLEQGSMTVSEYEARFHELSRYAMASIPSEFERIRRLVKGFAGYLQEATASLVLSGGSFQSIIDHARMIESIRQARQGGGKRSRHHGQFGEYAPRGREFQRQGAQSYQERPVHSAIPSEDSMGRPRSSQTSFNGFSGSGMRGSPSGYPPQSSGPRGCYVCDEFGHKAKDCPRRALASFQPGTQTARSTPGPAARGASQSARGGTRGARSGSRGGARCGSQASGERRVCYAVPGRTVAEASDAVITGIVPVCYRSASVLFDPGSTYSYVSTYFASDIEGVCEPLDVPICVSTPVGESLVVDRVYRGCVVVFEGRETQADLILLDMLDFDVILGMDWLSPYHAILDCYAKTVTLAYPGLPQLVWTGSPSSCPKGVISYVHARRLMDRGFFILFGSCAGFF